MGARKVLLILGGALLACLLICVVIGFFSVRGLRSGVQESVEDGMATVVAEQIGATGAASPGTYEITEADLLGRITETLDAEGADVEDLVVRISENNVVEVGFSSQNQDVTYEGTLEAVDGELVVHDMEANNGFLNFLMPGSKLANGIEDGVNNYLEANNLQLGAVSTTVGAITLDVVAGP